MRAAVEAGHMVGINHPFDGLQVENFFLLIFRDFIESAFIPDETHIVNDMIFQIGNIHFNLQVIRESVI